MIFGKKLAQNKGYKTPETPCALKQEEFIDNWGERINSSYELNMRLAQNKTHLAMLMAVSQKRER